MSWESVIGLELHVQLATKSKLFSAAATAYGAEPNTQACNVDLALPGVLPVLNREAVAMAIKFGLATGAQVASESVFARKNYFYPDLPKGYQISQYELPVVGNGRLEIRLSDGRVRTIGITRAHLEEDAGKSLHEEFDGDTGIDLNRAGTPLIEIVSEPELATAEEAVAYMKKIHSLVRYLEICDGNMEEGSFRCDANVSVRPSGSTSLGTRTEIKNINSFRFVEKAINLEIERQIYILETGGHIVQETRLYDAARNETRSMRSKEEANDYRYFPDPDLLPLRIEPAWLEEIRGSLPELPEVKERRFVAQYGLQEQDAIDLVANREIASYFEELAAYLPGEEKLAANWVTGELMAALNRESINVDNSPLSSQRLAQLLLRVADNTISGRIAKELFAALWTDVDLVADDLIESRGLRQISDIGELQHLVQQVLHDNPGQVEQYRAGKTKLMGFFVGLIMQKSAGKANPEQVNTLLKEQLERPGGD